MYTAGDCLFLRIVQRRAHVSSTPIRFGSLQIDIGPHYLAGQFFSAPLVDKTSFCLLFPQQKKQLLL
jgi:hypothetical protein